MSYPKELLRRLRMIFHRRQLDADLEEEMRLHLDLRGSSRWKPACRQPQPAAQPHVKFGNTTRIQEKSRMTWGWESIESFLQDANYGIRAMLRSPALTLVALLSLALGIGANTAIFSLLDAVLLRSLPVKDPHQLSSRAPATGTASAMVSPLPILLLPLLPSVAAEERRLFRTAAIFSMLNQVHGFVDPTGRASVEPSP
jgi:hypothetical protein